MPGWGIMVIISAAACPVTMPPCISSSQGATVASGLLLLIAAIYGQTLAGFPTGVSAMARMNARESFRR